MKRILLLLTIAFSQLTFAGKADFQNFKRLHKDAIGFYQDFDKWESQVNLLLKKDHILTGKDIVELNSEAAKRLKLTREALDFIDAHDDLTSAPNPIFRKSNALNIDAPELKDTMMSLALAYTLYDTYYFAYKKITSNSKVLALLSEKNPSYAKERRELLKPIRKFYALRARVKMNRGLDYYKTYYLPNALTYNKDPEFLDIHEIIQKTFSYSHFADLSKKDKLVELGHIVSGRFDLALKVSNMVVKFAGAQVFHYGSQGFGNTVGLIQSRHGKLFHQRAFIRSTSEELQPLDILLEKTPFRTTDKLIPGYWGHAAVYVGTEAQLKGLGLWNHPLVSKYHDQIKAGATIIEALRPGVQINSIEHFSDIDDFLAMRLNNPLTLEETQDHIIRAFGQVGKLYDFNFDVETGGTIVCSELAYATFTGVVFKTSKILGRHSISVDQVAERAISGGDFHIVDMWIDGKRTDGDKQKKFNELMISQGKF